MAKIKKEIELPKETCELMDGIGDFVYALRVALKDGFKMEDDMPVIVAEAMSKLLPAVDGVGLIDDEFKEDKGAVLAAVAICLLPKLLKKV